MRAPFLLTLFSGLLIGFGWSHVTAPPVARSQEAGDAKKTAEVDLSDVEAAAADFEKAYNSGNAEQLAALFLEDAEIVDEDGNIVQGRASIQSRFAEVFQEFPKARIAIEITSLRQLSPDVAVEDGYSTTTLSADEPVSRSPYTVVHLKRNGKWLMSSVRDFPAESSATGHDHLRQLEWMTGHWVDESPEGRVETTCQWSEDGNYLLQNYVVKARQGELRGTQRIAWDPLRHTIRSWAFDQSGAFTEATWTPVEDAWILKVEGVTPDGRGVSATRVVTLVRSDSYLIDSTSVIVGNELMPDSSVRVVRRPPAPAK